jgi:GNAT superfamily N-acetyltransferase
MHTSSSPPAQATAGLRVRPARFEEVSELLRLVERAVEHGCRHHYSPKQRREVGLDYAQSLFLEVLGPCETVVAELDGRLAGMAQLGPTGRLRALFVDAPLQGKGVGRELLAAIEELAMRRDCTRLFGAMSLNAVAFYTRAGFRPLPGPDRLAARDRLVPVVPMEKWLRPMA